MHFLIVIILGMVMLRDESGIRFIVAPNISGFVAVIASVLALVLVWLRLMRKKIERELETGRLPIGIIQNIYMRAQNGLRLLCFFGFFLLVFGTDWQIVVRKILGYHLAGLDELVIVLPFFFWMLTGYYFLYPSDCAIRQSMTGALLEISEPLHPVWTRKQFLFFQMQFQFLLIGLPLFLIIAGKDLIDWNEPFILSSCKPILIKLHLSMFILLVPQGLLAIFTGFIFLCSPFLVKFIWRASSLPNGELRTALQRLATRANLNYRDILLWPTYGVIVNAAVVGFFGKMRYIVLTDGLIESLTDGQIESVFGHEIGHVKLHHLPFYLIFSAVSMGLIGLVGLQCQQWFKLENSTTQMIILLGIALVWYFIFGFISRRFEAQSDLFGVKVLSSELDGKKSFCRNPSCLRHGLQQSSHLGIEPMCSEAADLFISALQRTASLNAIPRTASSWRHGSIQNRCDFVQTCASNLSSLVLFNVKIWWIKILLIAAIPICILWAMKLFSSIFNVMA